MMIKRFRFRGYSSKNSTHGFTAGNSNLLISSVIFIVTFVYKDKTTY